MSPGIGVGVGLPFVHLRRRSSSILDQLFGGGQGMYAVAGLREGSGAWTDQTGGGRHVTLPGGSADPIQLDHDGTDYFYFPGTTGNYLGVPDAAYLTPATSFRVEKKMRLGDWDSTTAVWTLWDNNNFGSGIGYNLQYNANGLIQLFYGDGSSTQSALSSAAPAFADNADGWIAAEILFDDGGGNHTITFETSTDGASWSTLGVVRTVAGEITGGFDGDTPNIDVANGAASRRIYCTRVVVDGTTVLDVNAADADEDSSTFTEASSNAATVTINRSASGYKTAVVTQPVALFATDDYLTIADTDNFFDVGALDSVTWFTVLRAHDNNASQGLLSKSSAFNTQGWKSSLDGASAMQSRIRDGSSNDTNVSVSFTEGVLVAAGGRVDRATGTQHAFVGATFSVDDDASAVGDMSNSEPVRLGLLSTSYAAMEVVAVAFTKQALTAQQISDAKDALLALNSGG